MAARGIPRFELENDDAMTQDQGKSHLRIDARHTFAHSASAVPGDELPPPPALLTERSEQLQTQAAELASHLQTRQTELNRREMQLNAFAARLENEERQQRLLASERQRNGKGGAAMPVTIDSQAEIDREHEQLALREAAISARESELAQQEQQILETSERTQLRERERELATEVVELTTALEKDRQDLQQQRREFQACRADFDARVQAREAELTAAETALAKSVRQRTASLRQQQQEITQHHAQLEGLRRELAQLHRDSMQMRLETEALTQQLAQDYGESVVLQALPEIRARLAASFQQEMDELGQRRAEVKQLLERLHLHEATLQTQQHTLGKWADRRETELQRQAAMLIERERALDHREAQLRQLDVERQEARLVERNEIWQLQRQLAMLLVTEKKGGTAVPPS